MENCVFLQSSKALIMAWYWDVARWLWTCSVQIVEKHHESHLCYCFKE